RGSRRPGAPRFRRDPRGAPGRRRSLPPGLLRHRGPGRAPAAGRPAAPRHRRHRGGSGSQRHPDPRRAGGLRGPGRGRLRFRRQRPPRASPGPGQGAAPLPDAAAAAPARVPVLPTQARRHVPAVSTAAGADERSSCPARRGRALSLGGIPPTPRSRECYGARPMPATPRTAVLVACKLPEIDELEFESSLTELERLVTTLGYRVVGRLTQARAQLSPTAVLGEGKLRELAELTGADADDLDDDVDDDSGARRRRRRAEPEEPRVDLVAVDHELTPSQLRQLERVAGTDVLDRTGVIIDIFPRHARSREARLQVEIARLTYEAPRVRESPRGRERQAGRGAGEAGLELDRRRIRDRIAELKQQLEAV